MVDAIGILKRQHRELVRLFERTDRGEDARELFDQIADALLVHAGIEEKLFYPATRSARSEDQLREAMEEHLALKRAVADLLEPSDPHFEVKLAALREQVANHVALQERELFPAVARLLSADELEELGMEMEDLAAGSAAREPESIAPLS